MAAQPNAAPAPKPSASAPADWSRLYRLLAMRRVLGIALTTIGTILSARLVPAVDYGVYLTASTFLDFGLRLATPGLPERILRASDDELRDDYPVAAGLAVSLAIVAAGGLSLLWFGWMRFGGAVAGAEAAFLLFATLPLWASTVVVRSRLERDHNVKPVVVLEVAGQVVFVAVTALWAIAVSRSLLAPVVGWTAQALVVGIGLHVVARVVPAARFRWSAVRPMLAQGVPVLAVTQIWYLRALVLPFVVGPLAGMAALASLQLALRLLERLQFISQAHWRFVAIAAPRFRDDASMLRRLLFDYSVSPTVWVGAALLAASAVPGWAYVKFFGPSWASLADVVPGLAAGTLFVVVTQSFVNVLVAQRRLRETAVFHLWNVGLLALASAVLTAAYGVTGYVWANALSMLSVSYLFWAFRNSLVVRERWILGSLLLALGAAFQFRAWGPGAFVPLVVLFGVRPVREVLLRHAMGVWRRRSE